VKPANIAAFLAPHAVAAGVYFALFLILPVTVVAVLVFISYVVGAIIGDLGGPLFLPALFVVGFAYSLSVAALGLVSFLVTGGIQFLRRYVDIPLWTPLVLTIPVVFVVLARYHSGIVLSILVYTAFCVYWLAFSGSDAVLKWIRKMWQQRWNG
jgi:hypothetical protein